MMPQTAFAPSNDDTGDRLPVGTWRDAFVPPQASAETSRSPDRGARLPKLIDVDVDLEAMLASLAVVVVGAGSVGMRIIDALTRMGVGEIRICDPRKTKPESLLTHPIGPDEIGVSKAELAARRAQAISPETYVRFYEGPFESLTADALHGASIVMIATDNLAAETAITESALHFAIPQIQASVYGPALVAQVRALEGSERGDAPCIQCSYTAAELAELNRGTRFSCEGADARSGGADARSGGADARSGLAAPQPTDVPTISPPHLCATAADLAVGELLRRFARLSPAPLGSELLEFCGYTGATTRTPLTRNPDCPLDHRPWTVRPLATRLEGFSPRALAQIAGHDDYQPFELALQVEGHRFASHLACDCDAHPRFGRFLRDGASPGTCHACGCPHPDPHPMHVYSLVPAAALEPYADRSLEKLGVDASRVAIVRDRRGMTLLRSSIATLDLHARDHAPEPTPNGSPAEHEAP